MNATSHEADGLAAGLPDELRESLAEVIEHVGEPAYRIVATRTLRLLAQRAGALGVEALADAADEPSDFDAVLRLLEILAPPPASREPFFLARIRGARMKRELLSVEGPPLSSEAVAGHLGVTRQAVNKRRQAGRLIAVPASGRGFLYPAWQLGEGGVLEGLEEVLEALEGADGWSRIRFFLTGDVRLGGERPLDALREGSLRQVLRAARAFGEQGAG